MEGKKAVARKLEFQAVISLFPTPYALLDVKKP